MLGDPWWDGADRARRTKPEGGGSERVVGVETATKARLVVPPRLKFLQIRVGSGVMWSVLVAAV